MMKIRRTSSDNDTVAFVGDSRAADWPPPDLPQFTFVNRGVGGQMSGEALLRVENDIAPLRPELVVLQIGINDLVTVVFYPERRDEITTTGQSNIQQLTARIVALGAKVILTTIFPVGDIEMFFYSPATITEVIVEVNTFIHTLARPEIVVFDAYTILAGDDGLCLDDYTQDFLHLNRAGYAALNRGLVDVLVSSP
jgi:lysophospholipase L1-like esterase